MSRLLTILLAGCATLAISGVGFAEDQRTRTEPRQEQNQDDQAGQATDEPDGQGQQAISDSNDQDEQAAIGADEEDTVFIIVPDDQDERAATDTDDQDVVVIVVPEDQDEQVSVETEVGGPAPQDEQQTVQEQQSQPSQVNSNADGAENTQDAAIPQPDYSAELKNAIGRKANAGCIASKRQKSSSVKCDPVEPASDRQPVRDFAQFRANPPRLCENIIARCRLLFIDSFFTSRQ